MIRALKELVPEIKNESVDQQITLLLIKLLSGKAFNQKMKTLNPLNFVT